MSDKSFEKSIRSYDDQYLKGSENFFIRWYYYLENGLNILNEFRNLFLGILGIYIALRLTNVIWMVVMFIPGIIVLAFLGHYNVHKLSKIKEWLNIRFSTHFAIKTFNYQQGMYDELIKLNKKLSKKK